MTKGLATL